MSPISAEWEGLAGLLSDVVAGCVPLHTDVTWRTFAAVMASYRLWTGGDRKQARTSAAAIRGDLGRALERWYERLAAPAPATTAVGVAP